MYEFSFLPFILVRQPALDPEKWDEHCLSDVLKQDFFLTAIWLASPGFFKELGKYSFNYADLPASVRLSLLRYLNRMIYRATPFGLFAAFALGDWEGEGGSKPVEEAKLHLIPDFRISLRAASHTLSPQATYHLNGSLYRAGRLYRFLNRDGLGFHLNSFPGSRLIKKLLAFFVNGSHIENIRLYLREQGLTEGEAIELFDSLLASGLLVSETSPNITGKLFSNPPGDYPLQLSLSDPYVNPESFKNIAGDFSPEEHGSPFYAIYERSGEEVLPSNLQSKLKNGINALCLLSTSMGQNDLDEFKDQFQKRYDRQEVPLLLALDPEYGVGYGFEDALDQNLVKDLARPKNAAPESLHWNQPNKLLLKLITAARGQRPVLLKRDDLAGLEKDKTKDFPPSMSVLFSVQGSKTLIESAGGANAMALASRFSTVNKELEEKLRAISREEESRNPEVIFAEIAFCPHDHAANINRRPTFYSYEIPVLTSSLMPQENQIPLNDLLISIHNGVLVLRSKRLNKRIIPRLSSAYNPGASSLSVFRLLYDLQYQGLLSPGFHLPSIFPGLNFYPRIEFENNVLSLATWQLSEAEVMQVANAVNPLSAWNSLVVSRGIPQIFRIGERDRTLFIDIRSALSLELLFAELKKGKAMLLTEVLQEIEQDMEVEGLKQYVAFMLREETIYPGLNLAPSHNLKAVKRKFLPADEWLYFKVYLAQGSANQLLLKTIRPLIQKLQKQGLIDTWFFIRYLDPDFHIRLRLKVKENAEAEVLALLNKSLQSWYGLGLIHEVQMLPYERELERYGAAAIEDVEEVFQYSSELSLQLLNLPGAKDKYYLLKLAIVLMEETLSFLPLEEKNKLIHFQYQAFFEEFRGDKKLQVAMDKHYRRLALRPGDLQEIKALLHAASLKKSCMKWLKGINKLTSLKPAKGQPTRQSLFCDLIHLQINRLFGTDQRMYEMLLYYFLCKTSRSPSLFTFAFSVSSSGNLLPRSET